MKKMLTMMMIVLLCLSMFLGIAIEAFASTEPFSPLWSRDVSPHIQGMAVDDINGDGKNEIVYAEHSGTVYAVNSSGITLWTFHTGWYNILRTGDLNHDGNKEVVVASADRNVYCIDGATGTQVWKFPTAKLAAHGNLTLADVTGDGNLEVVAGEWDSNVYYESPAKVYVISATGTLIWNHTFPDDTVTFAEDVDNNGKAEVVVYWGRPELRTTGFVTMFNCDGTIRWSTAVSAYAWGGIFFVDINGDGIKETIGCRSSDGTILILDSLTGALSTLQNNHGILCGIVENRFLTCDGNHLYALDFSGNLLWETPVSGYPPPDMPAVPTSDLNNDDKDEILLGTDNAVYVISSDGSVIWNTSSSRVWEARIGDIDGDRRLDIVVGTETELTVFKNNLAFPQYTLVINIAAGGTTNPAPGSYVFNPGDSATVTAIPQSGYIFDHWVLDGLTITDNPITITINVNHSLTAVFSLSYTLTISTNTGGTTTPTPGSYTAKAGSTLTVTAIPLTSYIFDHWTLDGETKSDNPITITMDANHSLVASFKPISPQPSETLLWTQWYFWAIIVLGIITGISAFITVHYHKKAPVSKKSTAISTKPATSKEYKVCPNCGATLPPNSTFCGKCGTRLE